LDRALKIIKQTICELDVSINGYTVLTEVGSDNYLYTPIIASLCGAKKIYALAKDTKYGLAKDIIKKANRITKKNQINNIEYLDTNVPVELYSQIDIITNSGNLRPIDKFIIDLLKPSAVVPVMFEAWELRQEDIDINYCKTKGIKVAGTWENHPQIKVFDYCGMLGVKMILDAGFEVTGNKIIVWSSDHFGEVISKKLVEENAEVILTNDENVLYENLTNTDIVYITDYHEKRKYFEPDGILDYSKIKNLNSNIMFVHLYGEINLEYCKSHKINISPKVNGRANVMTHTLGYVGLNPILKLQVAGFKVAQELLENNLSSLSQIL